MATIDINDPEQLKRSVARLLWRSKLPTGLTPEERKANWTEARRDYLAQAGKILRMSEQEHVSIVLVAPAESGDEGSAAAGEDAAADEAANDE